MFSKESGTKTSATVSNKYQIQLKKSICYRENSEAATVDVLQKKASNFIKKKLQHNCFPVNVAKFLRTPIIKDICKQLLLKISTTVTNLPKGRNS